MRSLTSSLLKHGAIITTEAKAKELRKHFEPLVTKAKKEMTLARRRQLMSDLLHKDDISALLSVAKANAKRAGGYLRLTRLPSNRHDAAAIMRIDIIDSEK